MRRFFRKVVCILPGVTEFGRGALRVKLKQNIVSEIPCALWQDIWRRHSNILITVGDEYETDSVYPPVAQSQPSAINRIEPAIGSQSEVKEPVKRTTKKQVK